MEIKLKIPEYCPDTGMKYHWETGFDIEVTCEDGVVLLKANREGLFSLANHLINLAQDKIPRGHHLHFDEINALNEGSFELVVEKK